MYQSYDLSHYLEGDLSQSTSFTVSDDDAINCAHMLAAGFNTISRKMMGDFVLAVVDTKAGVVQYDGKTEMINRLEPSGPFEFTKTFNFEVSPDHDGMSVLFENENGKLIFPSNLKIKTDEPERAEANAAAVAEMVSFVKRAHAKKVRLQADVPDGDGRPELDDRWRGMLDVLAKFLVITGEADRDESHAVARRLCGVEADEF
jgi:hypothetical protein